MLIMGGGYADIPMIEASRALGYHVVTSGNRAEDLGHAHSDETHLADFSSLSAMLDLARMLRVDAVCACCNDFSALSAAYVAEQLGLPGHDAYETAVELHHKDRYRAFARRNGIPSPLARSFDQPDAAKAALEQFTYPLIVKPVDLTGGKGVSRAETAETAHKAIDFAFAASRAKRVVVEEFIEGSRHGITSFIRGGKVVFHFDDDEYYYINPYLVSAASSHGSAPDAAIARLIADVEKIADLMSLIDGLVHVQFILDRNGRPVIIEICRRPPGDLYVKLVQHATGVNYPGYIVRAAAGLELSDLRQVDAQRCVARHCVMAPDRGVIQDVEVPPDIRARIFDSMMWWKPGDVVVDELTHKLGIVFLEFDSPKGMREQTARMQERIHVRCQVLAD